jgi:hypothetical protein
MREWRRSRKLVFSEGEASGQPGQVASDDRQPLAARHRQGAVQEPGNVPEVLQDRPGEEGGGCAGVRAGELPYRFLQRLQGRLAARQLGSGPPEVGYVVRLVLSRPERSYVVE